ncbi:MAG: hypothetical protein P4L84_36240 [Isosphaeraceae bacterium]|nr:hypothetical protein [Isosphaeraceae bacterium]
MVWIRLALSVAVALLPSWLKVPLYRRLCGYRIGKGVRIGLSPFVGVRCCSIGDYAHIGSFNVFYRVGAIEIGDSARIGYMNLFRGGERIRIGRFADILRQNVFNAIIEADFVGTVHSVLELGTGAVVTSGHWLDFSAGLEIGDHSIVGGRNSSFWTHNRQRGRGIKVGCHCYLGSEIRVAPGAEIPPFSIVALGSVLSGRHAIPRSLIGGNPATVVRALDERDLFLVIRKTRNDIPDDVVVADLPDDLRALMQSPRFAEGGVPVEPSFPESAMPARASL